MMPAASAPVDEGMIRQLLRDEPDALERAGLRAPDADEPITAEHLETLADVMGRQGLHALAAKFRRLAGGVSSL